MKELFHHPLCPHSRFIRLVLGELGIEPTLTEERTFERRTEFLLMNPAGTTPVLLDEDGPPMPGAGPVAEYLDEAFGVGLGDRRLMPSDRLDRVEVRRLLDWFNGKFFLEVSDPLVAQKVYKRFMSREQGGGPPDMNQVRAARSNIRYHLRYIGYLIRGRNWLGGAHLSYADLAAAAHLSSVDFLGDVPWTEDEAAREWYARIKSRPSFRPLLADRVPGMAPTADYADLDF